MAFQRPYPRQRRTYEEYKAELEEENNHLRSELQTEVDTNCQKIVIILSLSFLITSFLILVINMVNERPTITSTYTVVDRVLASAVNISYDFNFTISCTLYYDYYGRISKPCNEYIKQPINMGYIDDHPFVGSFLPGDNIYLAKTTTNVTADPSYIFLNINVIDPIITSSNYSVQDSVYRLYTYDSSMFVFV
ncbi:hypothetical protein C1645_822819 [Glomus cerebriforme]|uniref:Transmembrane protein n=1 Tax=Glomus cerebriforme TaxID=658196 RepID=A0A397T0I3_9GLOM|nr:hypothetical protein C1645_822819 [Glomus cerebriforme]